MSSELQIATRFNAGLLSGYETIIEHHGGKFDERTGRRQMPKSAKKQVFMGQWCPAMNEEIPVPPVGMSETRAPTVPLWYRPFFDDIAAYRLHHDLEYGTKRSHMCCATFQLYIFVNPKNLDFGPEVSAGTGYSGDPALLADTPSDEDCSMVASILFPSELQAERGGEFAQMMRKCNGDLDSDRSLRAPGRRFIAGLVIRRAALVYPNQKLGDAVNEYLDDRLSDKLPDAVRGRGTNPCFLMR